MKSTKWSRLAIALCLVMLLSFSLAACGGGSDTEGDAEAGDAENWTIGYNIWGAGTSVFDDMASDIDFSMSAFGVTPSQISDEFTADKELQNVQNFVAAGVNGIQLQVAAPPVLLQAADICKEAKLPFVLGIFVGEDADRATVTDNNEYYVGAVHADLYNHGYVIGKAAADDGMKTAILLGGNIGDIMFEGRIAGFTKAFVEEGGGTILDAARCTSPAESQEKATALISANRDADCLWAMAGDYVQGAVNSLDSLSVDMPIYASNAASDTAGYINSGRVIAASGGSDLAGGVALALLVNYLDGHKILDDAGKAPDLANPAFMIDKDNADQFNEIFFGGGHALTDKLLKNLVWRFNPDVSYATFKDFVENGMSFEALVEAHS